MNKTTKALNASFSLLNLIRRDKAWNTDIVDSVLDSIREALADHSGDGNEMVAEPWKCVCGANLYIDSNGAPASKAEQALQNLSDFHQHMEATEPKCSEHPDAPHGFDRNASHNAGRYVCECEGWSSDDIAYRPGGLSMDCKQEPIGFIDTGDLRELSNGNERQYSLFASDKGRMVAIYAAPVDAKAIRAEREWVDLTDAELNNLWIGNTQNGWLGLFRAVIAADREKNK